MSHVDDLKKAQELQDLLVGHSSECFVEACPGAGKTQTLVRRVSKRLSELAPRHGIAVLSFTNSAVDEFTERYALQSGVNALSYPSFVGTFDAFLNQFVVQPFGIPGCGHRPTIVDAWDLEVRLGKAGVRAAPMSMKDFHPIDFTTYPSRTKRLSSEQREHLTRYEANARRISDALRRKGMIASAVARTIVLDLLANKVKASALGAAITARFSEIIVDEAQDCNDDDVRILEWLRSHGAQLVLVCDPDQAIYEFRNGAAKSFRAFTENFPKLALEGNFRSSRVICEAAASMRQRSAVDLVVGAHRESPHKIQILTFNNSVSSKTAVSSTFMSLVRAADGVDPDDAIVLAHKRNLAFRISGNLSDKAFRSGSRVLRLYDAAFQYSTSTAPRQQQAAVNACIQLLMEFQGFSSDDIASLRPLSNDIVLRRSLYRRSVETLDALSAALPAGETGWDTWLEVARGTLSRIIKGGSGTKLLPAKADWAAKLQMPKAQETLSFATVHEAKGRAYDAVCLAIDNESGVLSDWALRSSATSEALRVLYVGLTRARKLAVLAIHRDDEATLRALLPSVEAESHSI
ncbi:UvrD-helicase domain-containing protein [Rhizobium leguminosarum]|uniref:DNA 3'-5' helicase n=1 Tax=Rhizobium leguminosarum TaxID=384 RepID=A0A1B1CHP6_RHILE|nr:ATP-dependent helicase [Rhizobium leguminosarum]ANP89274.1 hypothetical protein BA011_26175 [Rhizobium leguminosarum]